jgi:hypothetical protein
MSRFYTNFYARGNKIYLRGYQNGKRISEEVDYQPYLFIPSEKGDYLYARSSRLRQAIQRSI